MWLPLLLLWVLRESAAARPHILLIIADDLGWNDLGFHGSNQIPTPNIDALGYAGIIMQHHYVTPICTPSRSALMTGKYPIHTGMQHEVIYGIEPRGLPLSEKILPQYLKELGYKTHLVGKWHLGSYMKKYLPTYRGFDSHIGFWTGKIDMYDHTTSETGVWGHDFRRGFEVAYDLFGKYATDIYTDEAIKIIKNHNVSSPLFLMIGHSAVHSGNNYEFLRAPDKSIANFSKIKDYQRQKFAGMLSKLDESVGKVIASLQEHGLLNDSIVLFSTDNGGAAAGFNDNAASNYPLKGVKNTLWEGGVRGAACLWSPHIKKKSRIASQRMHLVDWLPTLISAAGGNTSVFSNIDGLDMWQSLTDDLESPRKSLVHNIDDKLGSASITVDEWKLHKGTNYGGKWDNWYGPDGREGNYDFNLVMNEKAGKAFKKLEAMPDKDHILSLRNAATLTCGVPKPEKSGAACKPLKSPCLFNIRDDPCEYNNVAAKYPEVLEKMLEELNRVNKTAVPPNNKKLQECGNPKYWGHVYTNFGDYERCKMTT